MERALPTTVELCQFDSSHANDRFPFFFPQQRKLMGSSAQNSSGVHWCRRRVKFCIPSVSQTRTVPQSINGQTGAKKNLEKLAQLEMSNAEDGVTLGTVNVKDAFLMVDQPTPLRVQLPFGNLIVLKNLPGQRLGAKCWCWHFRVFLTLTFNMEWCPEKPCLCKNSECALMIHVDDVVLCGSTKYWNEVFLKKLGEKYTLNATALGDVGSSISLLKRKLVRLPHGLALVPGTDVNKAIQLFEQSFGRANAIQMEDLSSPLSNEEAFHYRSVVGMLLYLARDRPGLLFVMKEFSQKMRCPTTVAVQRLQKVIGYLRSTGDFAVVLEKPIAGHGRCKSTDEKVWILESFSDADWSSNRVHRRSTSCGIHLLNG